jgi:prepilin-type N-terminal cleavage/methylation domain-containing protein
MRIFLHQPDKKRAARRARLRSAAGFSLMELIIGMAILLVMMVGASQLLMNSLHVRTRENQKSDALADAQRALNIMSREIGNSGFGLNYNGIVATDCHPTIATDPITAQIRVRANTANNDAAISQADEDITFVYQGDPVNAIVRYDDVTKARTVLASRIDAMQITYIDAAEATSTLATPTAVANAVRVRITIQVNLLPTGNQTAATAPKVLLTSDIALRNAPSVADHY